MPRPLLLAALLLAPLALAACARPESEETKAATSRADPKLEPGQPGGPDRLMPRNPESRARADINGAQGRIACQEPTPSIPC
jgi:hypothetical protein